MLLNVVGMGRMAVGVDVDVAAGWGDPVCVPRTSGSARCAALGNDGLVQTAMNEAAEPPQTSTLEKINILEKMPAGMGNEESDLSG